MATNRVLATLMVWGFATGIGASGLGAQPDAAWLIQGAHTSAERAAALPQHQSFWKASILAVVAASAVDAHSSWGKIEANPLLANGQGRFGARGVAVKGLITGAVLGAQWLVVRHNPGARRYAALGNFGMAAVYGRIATGNYGVRR